MSIYPAAEITSTTQQPAATSPAVDHYATSNVRSIDPNPGTSPKQESVKPRNDVQTQEMPQDEVQVQQDGSDGKIIIRYLDGSGNVILQIPSSQLLSLSRAIGRALDAQAKSRSSANSSGTGQESSLHGH